MLLAAWLAVVIVTTLNHDGDLSLRQIVSVART